MVELACWICVFFLDGGFKFEIDVPLIINWIVRVVQFHLDFDPMLSWAIFSVVGFFFYNYQFSMSSGKFSPSRKSSDSFQKMKSLTYLSFQDMGRNFNNNSRGNARGRNGGNRGGNEAGEIPRPVGEGATEMAHANRKIRHLYV